MEIVNSDVKTVVVLGSKPNSPLPATKADVVIAANSAVELAKIYRDSYGSKIISLTPCNHFGDKEYIQNSIKTSIPDEVVILGECLQDSENFVKEKLGLKNSSVTVLSARHVNWQFLYRLGFRRYKVLLSRILQRGPRFFFSSDIFNKDMSFLARSTGLNAIFYALERFPNIESIVIAGMGLQEGGHFNNLGEFTDKTARADRLVFANWIPNKRTILSTTDDKLNSIGHVSKWEGEVIS